MIKLIANGFGVLSTLCFIISFQVKSNKGLFIIQSIANVFYGVQFFLLGARGGLFNMGMQILRNILLCKYNVTFWTNSAKWLRLGELICVSPAWLLYDFISGAYGGVLTELVILGSVVVSIIRFGWKGLDDPDFSK